MKEINGFKYSRESFEDYELRLVLRFNFKRKELVINIYTTNTDKETSLVDILSLMNKDAEFVKMDHYATKQQDDNCSKMIDEWLKDV